MLKVNTKSMASQNQNKPQTQRNHLNKYRVIDGDSLDKHIKFSTGSGRIMAKTADRQALVPINNQKDFECENVYTKEEVNALLIEKFKGRMYDSKGKQEWMTGYIKKLKACIKWFLKGLEDLVEANDNLSKMLDSSERKRVETESAMKNKEESFNAIISRMETDIFSLEENLANEVLEKLHALDCHKRETEARMVSENNQDSLREKVERATQDAFNANEKVKKQEDMYKRLHEYNTSLQQYNTKLQKELQAAIDENKRVEGEKTAILENLSTLRVHHNLLRKELTSAKISGDDI